MCLAASLALRGDGIDLGAVASKAANPIGPALHYEVGKRHVFSGERLGNRE
jgi:hypothetical protein